MSNNRPRTNDDDEDEFALPSGIFMSSRRVVVAGARQQQQQQQQQQQEESVLKDLPRQQHDSEEEAAAAADIPVEHLAVISTYDKGNRGRAEESTRISGIHSRIRRSRQKDDTGEKRPLINDSLLKDKVAVTVGVYSRTAKYTSDLRTAGLSVADATAAATAVEEQPEEEEEEEDSGALAPMEIDRRLVSMGGNDKGKEDMYPDDDDDEDDEGQFHVLSNPPRELLFPIPAVPMAEMMAPDTEHYGRIDTFQEYAAPQKGRPQFDRTMQHIGGKEQTFFVEVAPDSERYAHVSGTLNEKIGKQAFLAHAIRTGREIPFLPPVTKAEARAARTSVLKGDCPCVKGNRCESYLYSKELIEKYPERYKGMQPWVCKEFYYGGKTDVVRQGIALGATPDKIKHDPVFCIMCHEQIVSQLYKMKKMNLEDPNVELHILHAYQYIIGPGEYPETAMLMGDNAFHGVAAPFIRYQRDNYVWIPDRTGGAQCWEKFQKLAPFLFLETVQQTIDLLSSQGHLAGRLVGHFLSPRSPEDAIKLESATGAAITFPTANQEKEADSRFAISPSEIIWNGLHPSSRFMDEPADEHPVLIAVFLRVNGANAVAIRLKAMSDAVKNGFGSIPLSDATYIKLNQFMQRHLPLAKELDQTYGGGGGGDQEDNEDVDFDALLERHPTAGGPTQFIEDKDFIQVSTRTESLEPTPFERLQQLGLRQGVLQGDDIQLTLAEIAFHIKNVAPDDELLEKYCCSSSSSSGDADDEKATHVFDTYYPIRMTTPAQCRACSWYLACLVVINFCEGAVMATKHREAAPQGDDQTEGEAGEYTEKKKADGDESDDDEEEGNDDDDDPAAEEDEEEDDNDGKEKKGGGLGPMASYIYMQTERDPPNHNVEHVHTLMARHAIHRIMGAFVPLFYHVLRLALNSDEGDLTHISDEAWRPKFGNEPTLLVKYFPFETACFHWGDLPVLYSILEHVGLRGVQTVKTQLPIVQALMKSLPICCVARDTVKGFLKQCRNKAGGEAYWRVVRGMFYCSLAGLYPGAARRIDFRSMVRLYHMLYVDREVFFKALERESEDNKRLPKGKKRNRMCRLVYGVFREYFVHLASRRPEWIEVVDKYIAWEEFVVHTMKNADEMRRCARLADAPAGNEFLFVVNALFRCKNYFPLGVYRYRKKNYVRTMLDRFEKTQEKLIVKRMRIEDEIIVMTQLLRRMVSDDGEEEFTEVDLAPLRNSIYNKTVFGSDPLGLYQSCGGSGTRKGSEFHEALLRALNGNKQHYNQMVRIPPPQVKRTIMDYLLRAKRSDRLRFEYLMDPRMGGINRQTMQSMYKTLNVYNTRSSPKSIERHVTNMMMPDFQVMAWYMNIVSRLERFTLIPVDAATVEAQAYAFRMHRFHLLPDEPLPPSAWTVYACFCCGRVSAFTGTNMYGNANIFYDPVTGSMVCGKKISRVARVRIAAQQLSIDRGPLFDDPDIDPMDEYFTAAVDRMRVCNDEMAKKECLKRARSERRDLNVVPCSGQPVIPIELKGCMLQFNGARYLFCPHCSLLHTYTDTGWGREGYRCPKCRACETPEISLRHCAFCYKPHRPSSKIKIVEVIATGKDPSVEKPPSGVLPTLAAVKQEPITDATGVDVDHRPLVDPEEDGRRFRKWMRKNKHTHAENPLRALQTLYLCQPHANSAGLFATHHTGLLYQNLSKEKLWEIIPVVTSERGVKYAKRQR